MAMTKTNARKIVDEADRHDPGICPRCDCWIPESGHEDGCVVLDALRALGRTVYCFRCHHPEPCVCGDFA